MARALCRPQDRMVWCELEPAERNKLAASLGHDRRAQVSELDGWTALKSLLPPGERRGLVLVDPPFEEPNEFERLLDGLTEAHRRFATGVYLLWYAIKDPREAENFARCPQNDGRQVSGIAIRQHPRLGVVTTEKHGRVFRRRRQFK